MQFIFWLKIFSTKIKRFNLVFKSLRLYFYILFLVANRDTYTKVINIANIYINMFRELEDVNTIIAFISVINSLYINKNLNNSRTRFLYLLKF